MRVHVVLLRQLYYGHLAWIAIAIRDQNQVHSRAKRRWPEMPIKKMLHERSASLDCAFAQDGELPRLMQRHSLPQGGRVCSGMRMLIG